MRNYEAEELIQKGIDMIYQQGLSDGKASVQIDESEAYQQGLCDAWKAARKLMLSSDSDGGIDSSVIIKIFGVHEYYVLKDFSASEAIAKIKEYEEKQKADDEIKVGDEVYFADKNYTKDAEPKTGHWKISKIPKGEIVYCSECGFGKYLNEDRKYNYCPNCGAKMEEQA